MKKKCIVVIMLFMLVLCLAACSNTQESASSSNSGASSKVNETPSPSVDKPSYSTSKPSSSSNPSPSDSKTSSVKVTPTFTNKFGTATTVCNHSGCSNYIATSGDTNCCTAHSKLCLECSTYIDEDAAWCMSCLDTAANKVVDEKENIKNYNCDICGKQATETINGEHYCGKHYDGALDWYLEQK